MYHTTTYILELSYLILTRSSVIRKNSLDYMIIIIQQYLNMVRIFMILCTLSVLAIYVTGKLLRYYLIKKYHNTILKNIQLW